MQDAYLETYEKKIMTMAFTLDNLTTGVQTELTNLGSFIALFSFRLRHFR